jgi:hypothetical protein
METVKLVEKRSQEIISVSSWGRGVGGGGDKIRRCKEAEDRIQWAVDKGWDK